MEFEEMKITKELLLGISFPSFIYRVIKKYGMSIISSCVSQPVMQTSDTTYIYVICVVKCVANPIFLCFPPLYFVFIQASWLMKFVFTPRFVRKIRT